MIVFRWMFRVVLCVIVLAGLVYLFRNIIIRRGLPVVCEKTMGVEFRAKWVRVEPFRGILELKGVWMGNPEKFAPGQPMLLADRIYVDLQGIPMPGTSLNFESALFDVDRLVVIRNSEGRINWKKLGDKKSTEAVDEALPGGARKSMRFDRLDLSLREIHWRDERQNPPLEIVIPLNLQHLIIRNVTEEELAERILREALKIAKGKVLEELLAGNILNLPNPAIRETRKVLDRAKKFGGRLKEKLGL